MKDKWLCKWCLKRRSKAPQMEQLSIIKKEWLPVCSYCQRRKEHMMISNPFFGLIANNLRDIEEIKSPIDCEENKASIRINAKCC